MIVRTTGGVIKATPYERQEDPSIDIEVNGQLTAAVEWHSNVGKFQVIVWDKDEEDPIFMKELNI